MTHSCFFLIKIGISIPRLPDANAIRKFASTAEKLGFESILAGDHIILPTAGTNQYPYTADGSFQRPSDEPFLETMTMLGYIAACTETIKLGSTVIILPYRNPIVQAKMFASLDVLTGGRMICGVGVGWLEHEFDTLGIPYDTIITCITYVNFASWYTCCVTWVWNGSYWTKMGSVTATGEINSTVMLRSSPGITISTSLGSSTAPVTSVVLT